MKRYLFSCLIMALLWGCDKPAPAPDYVTGKNRFTLPVDGATREYYVHVPTGYSPDVPAPMVIMLHGTGGDGEKFYNISGWKEVGESDNILTVFPSAEQYCIIDSGVVKNTTKWNVYNPEYAYCASNTPVDDVKFLRQMIADLGDRFAVDTRRIYVVGFSNGGQMAFRCAVDMSDVFAAVVENAGVSAGDTTYTTPRPLPVAFQLGNEDDRFFPSAAPLSQFEAGLTGIPFFQNLASTHCKTFQYQTAYTLSGDTTTAMIATYPALTPGDKREFRVVLVKNLPHVYPNGTNHWMRGAELHWAWMKQYTLP
ncbi:MAG: PHB depolymerase family esterase [Bacteroidia bacterium]|nr:PHB depolymerase family esterase [Bacteroidia bacterium]